MSMFAIITFRHDGPLKNWQAVRAANVHNARTQPLPHALPGAPPPTHLIGTDNLEQDMRRQLSTANIDPDRLRKNGVIAYEAILTASAEFFHAGTTDERNERLKEWTKAQVEWALKQYGAHRVVSMVLHEDEKTPHVHLVILPLEEKPDRRCTDETALRWKLVGRTVSGPGSFEEAQDAYSQGMAQFGLVRGIKGSGRKHEPVPVFIARMAEKEAAVDSAKRQLDTAKLAHDAAMAAQLRDIEQARERLASERQSAIAETAAERLRIAAERAEMEKASADHAAKVAFDDRRLAADRESVRGHLELMAQMERELQHDMDEQRAETAALALERESLMVARRDAEAERSAAAAELVLVRQRAAKLQEHQERLFPTFRAARHFREQIAAMKCEALSPAASATRAAVDALAGAAATVSPPAHERRPDMIAHYGQIQREGTALR